MVLVREVLAGEATRSSNRVKSMTSLLSRISEVRSPSSSLEKGQVVCLDGTSDTAGDEERARSGNAVKIRTTQKAATLYFGYYRYARTRATNMVTHTAARNVLVCGWCGG